MEPKLCLGLLGPPVAVILSERVMGSRQNVTLSCGSGHGSSRPPVNLQQVLKKKRKNKRVGWPSLSPAVLIHF